MRGRESGMPAENHWDSFFDADGVLSKLECDNPIADVVEFGCGYGLFTVAAAKRTAGVVYALDIDPVMIDTTRRKAVGAGCHNVCTERRDFMDEGSGRPDQSVGYAMLFNILHVEDPHALLREAFRVLIPGGKLGIMHWNYDPSTPRGPSMDIRPRPEQCQSWAEQVGFDPVRFDPLACCPYHYGLVAQRPLLD